MFAPAKCYNIFPQSHLYPICPCMAQQHFSKNHYNLLLIQLYDYILQIWLQYPPNCLHLIVHMYYTQQQQLNHLLLILLYDDFLQKCLQYLPNCLHRFVHIYYTQQQQLNHLLLILLYDIFL